MLIQMFVLELLELFITKQKNPYDSLVIKLYEMNFECM